MDLERRHPEAFDHVMRSRFRHPDDVSIASSLHHYYAYLAGRAVPGDIAYFYQDLARPDAAARLEWLLNRRPADVFCLNDTFADAAGRCRADRLVGEFCARYFPAASSFERATAAVGAGGAVSYGDAVG